MPDRLADYVTVAERLERFRSEHPDYGLVSEILIDDGQRVLVKASITFGLETLATGHAEEVRNSSPVNKTSAIENAETSAWGRALAAMGYEVKRGIASKEEMRKVSDWADDGSPSAKPYAAAPPIGTKVKDNPLPDAPSPEQIDELKKAVAKAATARKQDSRFVRKEVLDDCGVEHYERMTATQVGQWTNRLLKEIVASRKAAR